MRILSVDARPTGTAILRSATVAAVARAEQLSRLDSRIRPLSGLRSKRDRIRVRRALCLKHLEFTAIALAAVLLGGIHASATRARHGTTRKGNPSGMILSQQSASSSDDSSVLGRPEPVRSGSPDLTNAPVATVAIGAVVSGCPSRARLDFRTNCGREAATAEFCHTAFESNGGIRGERRRCQEPATAGGPEDRSAAQALEASTGRSREGWFLGSFRLVRGAETPASFRNRA